MPDSVQVIGRGRVGSAVATRLAERGISLDSSHPDVVLICVPDRAITGVAASVEQGPWVAHTSGGLTLDVLAPHRRRFSLHPLQTFTRARGAEQLDGAYAAISAETEGAEGMGLELAGILGLRPFLLPDSERALYHAGAVIASNFLVTLHVAASRLLELAGAPAEGLEPLMRRTIENGFQLTGPIARGDWETVEAHLDAIRSRAPEVLDLYQCLAETTAALTR